MNPETMSETVPKTAFGTTQANFKLIQPLKKLTLPLAFILFFIGCLYNGKIFELLNEQLTPAETEKPWLSRFWEEEVKDDGCKSLWKILVSHECIKRRLINDDTGVLKAVAFMTPFQKCRYLLIVRGYKFLAPYVLQMCILLPMTLVGILIYTTVTKTLAAGEINTAMEERRSAFQDAVLSRISSVIAFNQISTVCGFLLLSLFCSFLLYPDSDICEDSLCLFGIGGLSKTVFKQSKDLENIITNGKLKNLLHELFLLSSVFMILLAYFIVIIFFCLVAYVITDTIPSIYDIFKTESSSSTIPEPGSN